MKIEDKVLRLEEFLGPLSDTQIVDDEDNELWLVIYAKSFFTLIS